MQARGDARKNGRQHDLREHSRLADAEVLCDFEIDGLDAAYGSHGGQQYGEKGGNEDDDEGRHFADAEKEHDERQPGHW